MCLLMHNLGLPLNTMHTIHQKLTQLQKCHDTDSCYITQTGPIVGHIFQILRDQGFFNENKSGETSDCNINVDASMHVVGKQGRYLIYRGFHTNTPSMVLMIPPPHVNLSRTSKEHIGISEKNEVEDDFSNSHNQTLNFFSCAMTQNISGNDELGNTSSYMIQALLDTRIHNSDIVSRMLMFSHACKPSDIDLTPDSDIEQNVYIPMQSGRGTLPITRLGLEHARNSLRTVGCMILSEGEMTGSGFTRNILIAQNHHFQVNMNLHAGVFKLCLYHTEDVLQNDPKTNTTAIPIVVISHTCHRLDNMVEEIHTDHTVQNKRQSGVYGMIKLANSLLRESIPLTSITSIASIPDDEMYRDMSNVDIVKSLAALKLQHDNASVVSTLNKAYGGKFAKHTDADELKTIQCIKSVQYPEKDSERSIDFKLVPSGCLNHAIAHQNQNLSGPLNKSMGWDLREISTALCSGMAYCESRPYATMCQYGIGLVNETDFSTKQRSIIKKVIHMKQKEMFKDDGSWKTVRHNFTINKVKNDHIIECTITHGPLLLFRRQGMSIGVYAMPCLYEEPIQQLTSHSLASQLNIMDTIETGAKIIDIINPGIESNPKSTIKTPNKHSKSSYNIIPTMNQIGNKYVGCRTSLLCNATEMLYYINVICMHNAPTRFEKKNIHQLVRDAWLVTHMIYAAKICGGYNNSEFYMIYSHLQNLKSLPFDSVGYWATVPYV
jgi:hypothetical protein